MNTRYLMLGILLVGLSACGFHKTPAQKAQWFFDHGQQSIIKSLKKQDASAQQLDVARTIMQRHEAAVTQALVDYITQQHNVFTGLVAGQDKRGLLGLEDSLHMSHLVALGKIGTMHEELEQALGAALWQAAGDYRRQKLRRHVDG